MAFHWRTWEYTQEYTNILSQQQKKTFHREWLTVLGRHHLAFFHSYTCKSLKQCNFRKKRPLSGLKVCNITSIQLLQKQRTCAQHSSKTFTGKVSYLDTCYKTIVFYVSIDMFMFKHFTEVNKRNKKCYLELVFIKRQCSVDIL